MSWRGVFVGGPLNGPEHDRLFMGSWQSELYFVPFTAPHRFLLIGTNSVEPDPPWPNQIKYVRNDERSSLIAAEPGEDEGFAIFEWADGA